MKILNRIAEEVEKLAVTIRELEAEATSALYNNKDDKKFKRLMLDKTLLLFHFPEKIEVYMAEIDADLSKFIRHQIGGFSHGAEKALAVNSSFYMSALLYPENYQKGENNDLEVFLHILQEKMDKRFSIRE